MECDQGGAARAARGIRRATALAVGVLLLLAGCGTAPGNHLDALRRQQPDALAQAAADYQVVTSCLLDRELRRGYQPIPNLRAHERRATLTAYAATRSGPVTSSLLFEYSIEEVGRDMARIAIRRTSRIHWPTPAADVRLREDLDACGISARLQSG